MNLLQQLEQEQVEKLAANRPVPKFQPGDTVRVGVKVVEGERERIQIFEGVCIGRKNAGVNSNFTLNATPSSGPNGGDLKFQPLQAIENIDPRLAQAVQKMRPGETFPQVIETRFGFHILKLMEKDAGGQKDLSDPRVQAQVRQAIFNRKDQTLKNAFSEAARNKATVMNFLAERILAAAGKSQ